MGFIPYLEVYSDDYWPLGRDPCYQDTVVGYATQVMKSAYIINMFPEWSRPYVPLLELQRHLTDYHTKTHWTASDQPEEVHISDDGSLSP